MMRNPEKNPTTRIHKQLLMTTLVAILLFSWIALPAVFAANSTTESVLVSPNNINGDSPTITKLNDPVNASWGVTVTPQLQYFNASSVFAIDLIENPKLDITAGTNTANNSGNYQSATWFSMVRIEIAQTGAVNYVNYLANSSVSNTFVTVYHNTADVLGVGSTSAVLQQDSVLIDLTETDGVSPPTGNGLLTIYTVDDTGNILRQLANVTVSGFWQINYVGSYDPAGCTGKGTSCTTNPVQAASAGFAEVVLGDESLNTAVDIAPTINLVIDIVPLVVVLAVLGMIIGMFKKFDLGMKL